MFSGTVHSLRADVFDVPGGGSREERFTQFALAAIGDTLDESVIEDVDGSYITQIECFSGHFQSWKDRPAAGAEEVRGYLRAHAYWAWEFGAPTTDYGFPDTLRLGVPYERLRREAELYDGEDWTLVKRGTNSFALDPDPGLVKAVRGQGGRQFFAQPAGRGDRTEDEPSEDENPPLREPIQGLTYVDEARIAELRQVDSTEFDLLRVIAFCDELNLCYRSQCYLAVASLLRALLDHIAPIFGHDTFAKAANNYSGGATFKRNAVRLDNSARYIGNINLHRQIGRKETVPNRVQVSFSNELDVVLEEVVRILG